MVESNVSEADVLRAEQEVKALRARFLQEQEDTRYSAFRARYDANELMQIGEFCPPGTQIKSPSGLALRPKDIVSVFVKSGLHIVFAHGAVCIEFHGNVEGTGDNLWKVERALRGERWAP